MQGIGDPRIAEPALRHAPRADAEMHAERDAERRQPENPGRPRVAMPTAILGEPLVGGATCADAVAPAILLLLRGGAEVTAAR